MICSKCGKETYIIFACNEGNICVFCHDKKHPREKKSEKKPLEKIDFMITKHK